MSSSSNTHTLAVAGDTTSRGGALSLIPRDYSQALDFATSVMAKSGLVPIHLQGKPADCFLVLMQAMEWGMNPLAVAQKTSVIHGRLMYEGQLVAAVVNTRLDLEQDLDYQFSGEGTARKLVVVGKRKNWPAPRSIELTFQQATLINKNGAMKTQPDQQMCYIGARIWTRRHAPNILLGIYTPDEPMDDDPPAGEQKNVTGTGEGGTTGGETLPPAEATPPKRAKVPGKNKGAAAIPGAEPAAAAPIEAEVKVATQEAAPAAANPPAETPKPAAPAAAAPKEDPKPAAPAPASPAPAPAGEYPKVVIGLVEQVKVAPTPNHPTIKEVKVMRLCGGTCKIGGSEQPLAQLGRVILDPENPKLADLADPASQTPLEFTIEERDGSKPGTKNLVCTSIKVATPANGAEDAVDM